jgi:predicted RNase H-related nuclease YkuK (DUF458 family)
MNLTRQAQVVRDHLFKAGSISGLEAHTVHRIRSLSRRISELVAAGYDIQKQQKKDVTGQRYVRYSIYRPNFVMVGREAP